MRKGETGTIYAISQKDKRPARREQLHQEAVANQSANQAIPSISQSSTFSGKPFASAGGTMFSGNAQIEYVIQIISYY